VSISEDIRSLAREGLDTAEIARRLGIRYQHAYNVLKNDRARPNAHTVSPTTAEQSVRGFAKPTLLADELIKSGFEPLGRWVVSDAGDLCIDRPVPSAVGVYAFAKGGVVLYVGVATMGLAKRLYFYRRPGATQRTSRRINGILKDELKAVPFIDILVAMPPDPEWNGLPMHGSAGLELGLIKKYALPWNKRSAGNSETSPLVPRSRALPRER